MKEQILEELTNLYRAFNKLTVAGESQADIYLGCCWLLKDIINQVKSLEIKEAKVDGGQIDK